MFAPRFLKTGVFPALIVFLAIQVEAVQPPAKPAMPAAPQALSAEYLAAAQKKLHATFSQFKFDEIRPSEIPGVLEIYAGPRILYYAPDQEILILGELYAANGVSITEEKIGRFAARQAESIDKSTALVVGEGDTELLAFVDPDCHYCREANQWLAEHKPKNVRELIFFMPTTGRPQATARATQALCAPASERREALRRTFEPSAADLAAAAPACEGAAARLAAQAQIASKVGVYATPFFVVKGQVIAGFDRDRLSALLKPQKHSEGEMVWTPPTSKVK